MRTVALIAGVLAAGLVAASSLHAQPLRYWGKQPGAATGFIELGDREYYAVEAGTEIPAWGRVKQVDEFHLVVEQVRSESEKGQLRQRGAMVYDVLEIHILRQDLHHLQGESLRAPRR